MKSCVISWLTFKGAKSVGGGRLIRNHPIFDTKYFIDFGWQVLGRFKMGLIIIFQDKSVTSSIPDYFQNSEPPIICYKYNKPIRNMILISISLCLILTSMLIHLMHEIVKILNLYTCQLLMLSLEI